LGCSSSKFSTHIIAKTKKKLKNKQGVKNLKSLKITLGAKADGFWAAIFSLNFLKVPEKRKRRNKFLNQ
jgi:hypothetical protein